MMPPEDPTNAFDAAVVRLRRVASGERQRAVYGFDDEKMDDFMYRMLENAYVADLKQVTDRWLSEHPDNR